MGNKVIVYKGRTNTIEIDLGFDISADTWTSEIRVEADHESTLIASWVVDFSTDGTDGLLTLVIDNGITADIEVDSGFMDLKRVTGGEPVPVFDRPLEVSFRGTVTA